MSFLTLEVEPIHTTPQIIRAQAEQAYKICHRANVLELLDTGNSAFQLSEKLHALAYSLDPKNCAPGNLKNNEYTDLVEAWQLSPVLALSIAALLASFLANQLKSARTMLLYRREVGEGLSEAFVLQEVAQLADSIESALAGLTVKMAASSEEVKS